MSNAVPVSYDNNPSITDVIYFRLQTPDANGCFLSMPYKFDNLTIYFVERDFSSNKTSEYIEKKYNPVKLAAAEAAEAIACDNPTSQNIENAKKFRAEAESAIITSNFYFNQSTPIKIVGNALNPAWLTGHQITGISKANPTVITSNAHGLSNGNTVYIYASNSTPPIDGEYQITYINSNSFSIPVDLSDLSYVAGTSGIWYTAQENSANFVSPVMENNKTVVGNFEYFWKPVGAREGDYFICWTWTPLIAGTSLSSHIKFSVAGNTQVTTSIPTHFTDPEKYPTLLERYTPEMFKNYISNDDITPQVINKFNSAISQGFVTLENLTNQIVDLQDSNALHEALLPYLSNYFNLKLKSADPTKWRGQIKRAIPVFKSKGTIKGLKESFNLAGMKLLEYNKLWQVISKYTWVESFVFDGTTTEFSLEKSLIEPLDLDNFELSIRFEADNFYTSLTSDYVDFNTTNGVTVMSWVGDALSVAPISLNIGDRIKVLYQYELVPNSTEQNLNDYIRLLPLIDNRNEKNQDYPKKNWNVYGISEKDVLFDLIIKDRHPYHDFLVFGKIRTEFPYSENIYNMEEYNGSIRNSKAPCDIDKNFIDSCSNGLSSSYTVDVEIENLSNDRIQEFYEILSENTPFHAILNSANFYGGFSEFISAPVENIEIMVKINFNQAVLSGEAQMYFHRSMRRSNLNNLPTSMCLFRDDLADATLVASGVSATAYNSDIVVYCPTASLTNIGIYNDHSAIIQILDGLYQGSYIIWGVENNIVRFNSSPTEPIDECNNVFLSNGTLNTCAFPFRIINPIIDNFNYGSLCDVAQDNLVIFSDENINFSDLNVKSQFDVQQGTAVQAWEILIPSYSATKYTILNVKPDGKIVLLYDASMPSLSASGLSYTIYNGVVAEATGVTGKLDVTHRARVTVLNTANLPIVNLIRTTNHYHVIGSMEYEITSLVDETDDQFYISNYSSGDVNGINLIVNRRIIDEQIGYMTHRGLNVEITGVDYETNLQIQNGVNQILPYGDPIVNSFKENFIVEIDDENYYMAEINGNDPVGSTTIQLYGSDVYWRTLANGGTNVNLNIYKYTSKGATIMGQQKGKPEHTFESINRNGSPTVTGTEASNENIVVSLSDSSSNMPVDMIKQNEGISYTIQYSNGKTEKGEL
jgi:hypothetical protein